MSSITTKIPLPPHYSSEGFLSFHRRDKQNIAEIVTNNTLRKGILWKNTPTELIVQFEAENALFTLNTDSTLLIEDNNKLTQLGQHLLGLQQAVEIFEDQYQHHPIIGTLVSRQRGLRIYQSTTPFEALVWAIIGQQISVSAAISIRRRFIIATSIQHSSGIWCFPDYQHILNIDDNTLKQVGFSAAKITALKSLCLALSQQEIDLSLNSAPEHIANISEKLLNIKGIGPWTVSYTLLRGFNYLDGSLHGDVAVRRNLQLLLQQEDKISMQETAQWLASFSPWRALVAAHLWHQQSVAGY